MFLNWKSFPGLSQQSMVHLVMHWGPFFSFGAACFGKWYCTATSTTTASTYWTSAASLCTGEPKALTALLSLTMGMGPGHSRTSPTTIYWSLSSQKIRSVFGSIHLLKIAYVRRQGIGKGTKDSLHINKVLGDNH